MSDDTITIDPITGRAITCRDAQAEAERCFDAAYTSGDPRGRLGVCYRRAKHVVRTCGVGVAIHRRGRP